MVVLPPEGLFLCMGICPILTDELLQFSFSDEGLNLLFQIVAIRSIVTMIAVETAIFVPGSLFSFPGNVRDPSSLICISTWSSGAFRGVNLVNLPPGEIGRASCRERVFLSV